VAHQAHWIITPQTLPEGLQLSRKINSRLPAKGGKCSRRRARAIGHRIQLSAQITRIQAGEIRKTCCLLAGTIQTMTGGAGSCTSAIALHRDAPRISCVTHARQA